MPAKIKNTTKQFKKLIPQIRKDYGKTAVKHIKRAILKDLLAGISPVNGQGKFTKYSDSYKEQIRSKALYFTNKNGKVVRAEAKRGKKFETIQKVARPRKATSPVTLRLTGKTYKSLIIKTKGSFTARFFKLVIQFKSNLSKFHNKLGAGKSKVVRRMLPTEGGEKFNRRITRVMLDRLELSVQKVVKKFDRS